MRRQALILSEPFLATDESLRAAFLKLATDGNASVQFQFALSSLYLPQPLNIQILDSLLQRSPDDPWIRQAVMMSAEGRLDQLLQRLLQDRKAAQPAQKDLLIQQLFANVAASAEPEKIFELFAQLLAKIL